MISTDFCHIAWLVLEQCNHKATYKTDMSNFKNSSRFSDSTDTGNGHQVAQFLCTPQPAVQFHWIFSYGGQDVAYIIVFALSTSKRPNLHLQSILICIHISILVPCNWIANNMHQPPSSLLRAGKISDGALYVTMLSSRGTFSFFNQPSVSKQSN